MSMELLFGIVATLHIGKHIRDEFVKLAASAGWFDKRLVEEIEFLERIEDEATGVLEDVEKI